MVLLEYLNKKAGADNEGIYEKDLCPGASTGYCH